MNRILDSGCARDGALGLLEAIEDLGLSPYEAIPALMRAALLIASEMPETTQALDEAVRLLDEEIEA